MSTARARIQANALRDHLLYEYAVAPASPADLARRLRRPLNLVSYHTGKLLQHGFVELVRTEERRGGTAHIYRAAVSSVIDDEDWLELPPTVRRALTRGLLADIAHGSQAAAMSGGFDAGSAHVSRWPVSLDQQALDEIAHALRRLLFDLEDVQAAVDARNPAGARRVDVVAMGFRLGSARRPA